MKKKAQAIQEYVLLIAIIGAAIGVMQIYFRRSINSVIKVAADQVGSQKDGAADIDYIKWEQKQDSLTFSTGWGSSKEEKLQGAAVSRSQNETSVQEGVGSYGLWQNTPQ